MPESNEVQDLPPTDPDEAAALQDALLAEQVERVEEERVQNNVNAIRDAQMKEAMRLETMGTPTICRMIEYRSRTGNYSLPAVINCTVDSIYQPGVEEGHVPALTSRDRVHLTVFSPGRPGMRHDADNFVVTSDEEVSENVAGCYQEWNIPFDPEAGPGTWRWPARV